MPLTVRHYLFPPEGEPLRISRRLAEGLVSGNDAIPDFAGTPQRVLSAVIDNDEGQPQEIIRTTGGIWHFDHEGRIVDSLQESLFQTMQNVERGEPRDSGNVVALGPKLGRKRHAEKFRWEPEQADIEKVIADIWPKKGVKRLNEVKGVAPRRPPLTWKAKRALDEASLQFFKISMALSGLSEQGLKGLAFEARERSTYQDDDTFLYRAVAEMADRQHEILRRRRTGKGVWYAVVNVTRWDDDQHGTMIAEHAERCHGQAAAVEAARRLLAKNAEKFSINTTVDVSIVTDIERQADEADDPGAAGQQGN
ncbi:hypothetical protein [Aurantimonas coralicida]|uniref:hypothetical protein n=1 Tax=Aurantimonas coralicida TaxID=182270 RepID=UPI001E2A42FE|nr:hypothetical protein [Aurantimonas coralicida]MCD1644819.1 hypothetical protein [Aurantimonas coralicida]